jgi:hypothetical protein
MICITSKKEGFRRCGVSHTKEPVEYADDKFSEEEIAVLEADPMLAITHVEDKIIAETPALKDMTVAELKGLMEKLVLPYDTRATKAVLIKMIEANTAEPPLEDS